MTLTATTERTLRASGAALPAPRPIAVPAGHGHRVRVWDLPTRVFHWSLVACVTGLVVTGYIGGGMMDWHARFGYAVLALVLFRIVWGFAGGRWSRFVSFLPTPRRVIDYLRRGKDDRIGHNPLGALSVFAMLAMLLVQVATGLVSDDEIGFTGPLNRFITAAQGLSATWFHKQVGQWALAVLIGAHVAAIAFYFFRRKQNLVAPMVGGDKLLDEPQPPSRDDAAMRWFAVIVFAVCACAVTWLTRVGA